MFGDVRQYAELRQTMLTDGTCVSARSRVPDTRPCCAWRRTRVGVAGVFMLPLHAGPAAGANFPRSGHMQRTHLLAGSRSRGRARAAPDLELVRLSRQVLERETGPPVHDPLGMSKHARRLS